MPDVPGSVKRKACPKCGGDLRAEQVEYKAIEWVCVNLCGARYTPDQLVKALDEKAARDLQEKAAREKIEEAVKMQEEIDKKDDRQPVPEEEPEEEPESAGKGITYTRTDRKKAKNCKTCQFFRKDGAETWCITKSCPSHYPRKLRPVYHTSSYKKEIPSEELTEKDKQEIVEYAKAHTIKTAEKKYGIPWTVIRSLVAAAAKKPAPEKVGDRQLITKELPPWNESWGDPVKVEWLRTIRELQAEKK